jgi:O-antigen ligase
MLAEQGVPGLLIALALIGVFFLQAEKNYSRLKHTPYKNLYMACTLCGSAFWLNNLFSDLLEANKLAPLYFIILAVMMRVEEWDRKRAVKGA